MNDFLEVRNLFVKLYRAWWLIALFAVGAGALAYGVSSLQTPMYQSSTSLLVGRAVQAADLSTWEIQTSQAIALTYADLARRQPVLSRTVEELGLEMTWQQLRNQVRTNIVSETQLLEIITEADSSELARQIADEVARQLILLSPSGANSATSQSDRAFLVERIANLQQNILNGQTRVEELETAIAGGTNQEDVETLNQEIIDIEGLIAKWESNYAQLLNLANVDASVNDLAIIEPASANPSPVRPRTLLNTIVGIILGAIAGITIVLVRDFLDDSIHTPEDVTRALDLLSLGAINKVKGRNLEDILIINQDPFSRAAEDYRLLRSKIQFRWADNPGGSVMMTGPMSGEGVSSTVANLGIVMAQAGLRTVIIDANLRTPVQHELFRLNNGGKGLTHLLRVDENDLAPYLSTTLVPNLKVLTSGSFVNNPSELLGSQRMQRLLARLRDYADIVLLDSAPAVSFADAAVLSNKVDDVVLVVRPGYTTNKVAREAVFNLEQANASIMGVIVNQYRQRPDGASFSDVGRSSRPISNTTSTDLTRSPRMQPQTD